MARIVIVIAVLGIGQLAGCEPESEEVRAAHPGTHLVADVVARAGRLSIGASEVATRMAAEELSAEDALQQLIREALLAQEAERIGFTESRESERAVERLMVRAMLHDLEEENTPASISEAEVRADYAQHADERRVSERPTLDEVEEQIRERLSQKKRIRKIVEIVQGLEARGLVQYDDRGVERLLSMTGLPERAE